MSKDYYKILGVTRSASAEEIKKTFRRLAHEHHPDKGGDPAKFKDINEAYQALSDAQKRKTYDQFGSAAFEQGAGGGGFGGFDFGNGFAHGVDFGDLGNLGEMFGEMFGMGGGRRSAEQMRGADIEMDITLTFHEAAFGVKKKISLYRHVSCEHCRGEGAEPGTNMVACSACHGSGHTRRTQRTIFGMIQTAAVCEICSGRGKKPATVCRECKGIGIRRSESTVEVPLPPAMSSGEALKMSGQGEAAPYGGRAGDLYLRVSVKADPRFARDGHDVLSTATLPLTTFALGGTADVETLDGKHTIHLDAGTPIGAIVSLRGLGIAFVRGGRGNHRVTLAADVPRKLSKEQKRLLEELRKEGI